MPHDVWVYREAKRRESGARVGSDLSRRVDAIERASGTETRRRLAIEALVIAGELEAALADARSDGENAIAALTDGLAAEALGLRVDLRAARRRADAVTPSTVTISPPEGFAYYALHPEAYARASRYVEGTDVLVAGIRSIGTTLSAIVRAALEARGVRAERITVRPTGDPFDRWLPFVPRPRDGATVLVVDEGPGLSGSTFLAVAEAFVRAGVAPRRIILLTSHEADLAALRAPNAVSRWRVFRTLVAPSNVRAPVASGGRDLSGGAWRELHCRDSWPSSFVSAERRKVLTDDGRLFKYEGLGSAAVAARERAMILAAEKLAPEATDAGDGWIAYPWEGRPLRAGDLDGTILDHLALTCARRRSFFETSDATDLRPVITKNARVLLDREVDVDPVVRRAVVVDGHVSPHEWIRCADGAILKTDGISHGDDHFFPGPTDIAWDLAGIIVEWELGPLASSRLLDTYARASGDNVVPRLAPWLFAYAICRAAFTAFARHQLRGSAEEHPLLRDLDRYLSVARALELLR